MRAISLPISSDADVAVVAAEVSSVEVVVVVVPLWSVVVVVVVPLESVLVLSLIHI